MFSGTILSQEDAMNNAGMSIHTLSIYFVNIPSLYPIRHLGNKTRKPSPRYLLHTEERRREQEYSVLK